MKGGTDAFLAPLLLHLLLMPVQLRLPLHLGHVGRFTRLIARHILAAVARQFILPVCKQTITEISLDKLSGENLSSGYFTTEFPQGKFQEILRIDHRKH